MTVTEQLKGDVIIGMCKSCGNPCLQEEISACDLDDEGDIVIFSCTSCE